MKKLITLVVLATLLAPLALAVVPQQITDANNEMLMWMDKYTWDTYVNPYTGETVTVSAAERLIAKTKAVEAYNLWRALALEYAQELGLVAANH